MTEKKTKNNISSSGLSRRSRNKDIHSTGFPVKRGMTKDLESGRSMVEMLGVLAVVGVLSVGSIAGYTYAMNKYYANELLAGASERAVLVAAQIASGRRPNLNEFANHTVPNGTFGDVEEFEDGGFGIKVSKVKDAVCQNILKAVDGTEVFIAKDDNADVLNEISESDCSGDDNSFWFVYADDMGAIDSIFDPDTPTDEEKKGYLCYSGYQIIDYDDRSHVVTDCACSNGASYYGTENGAVDCLCEGNCGESDLYTGYYYCEGRTLSKVDSYGDSLVHDCTDACSGTGYFLGDQAAIDALCYNSYYCESKADLIRSGYGHVTSCNCVYSDYVYQNYHSDEEAIAAMCDTTLEEYTCSGNYIVKNGNYVSGCAVCTNAGTYYSDEEAIRAMCTGSYACSSKACVTDGLYYCDENNLLGQKGNGNFYSWCDCKAGIAKFEGQNFDSEEAAIAAMCE